MEMRKLGKTDVMVSSIILGTWSMGGLYWKDPDDTVSVAAVRQAMESGINTFDTAETYGFGRSETVLGKALEGVERSSYTMISKCKYHYTREEMRASITASLERLKTDYLDVYFIHRPPLENTTTIEEAMTNILELKKEGLIRAVGVSNFSLPQLQQALAVGPVDVIQPCYNLLWRYEDEGNVPFCRDHNIGIITYSSLAQGLLTGTFRPDTPISDGRKKAALFQPGVYEKCLEVTRVVTECAARYGKTPAQAAINWLVHTPGITAPIVGGSTQDKILENVQAVGWHMDKADYDIIDAASKAFMATIPHYLSFFNTDQA